MWCSSIFRHTQNWIVVDICRQHHWNKCRQPSCYIISIHIPSWKRIHLSLPFSQTRSLLGAGSHAMLRFFEAAETSDAAILDRSHASFLDIHAWFHAILGVKSQWLLVKWVKCHEEQPQLVKFHQLPWSSAPSQEACWGVPEWGIPWYTLKWLTYGGCFITWS